MTKALRAAMGALRVSSGVLSLLLLFTTGCVAVHKAPAEPEQPTVLPGEVQAYEYAVQTYAAGDYEASARLFGELADTALDPVLARKAFYGLALSRLVGAETSEDFEAGMALWADWASLAPAELDGEDPRLMAPLLERVSCRLKAAQKVLAPAPEPAAEPAVATAEQDRQLAAAAKEIGALKARLKELALENEKLRNQLSALEALHQEILIKKKGFD